MTKIMTGEAVSKRRAKFVGRAEINGRKVSFFTPPHDEPDFLWVDFEELALAFLPPIDAERFVGHAHNFGAGTRPVTTAANGARIATICSHPMAQGFVGFIDHRHGHVSDGEGWNNSPAHRAYCMAAAEMENEHGADSFESLIAAFKNQGGPFMKDLK